MRHAFDADHIAARIDNTTRKLMADRQRPLSLSASASPSATPTIVFALCLLLAFGVRAPAGQVEDDASGLHTVTGLAPSGVTVSGVFLLIIGILNLIVLRQVPQGLPPRCAAASTTRRR